MFEKVSHCAAILASRYNGFSSLKFKDFLSIFIRELDFDANYSTEPKIIEIFNAEDTCDDAKEEAHWANQKIPFCAVMRDIWNPAVEEFLKNQGAYLGTSNYPTSLSDFYKSSVENDRNNDDYSDNSGDDSEDNMVFMDLEHNDLSMKTLVFNVKEIEVLNIECKFQKKSIGQATTEKFIEKLTLCNSRLNILVCVKFGNLDFKIMKKRKPKKTLKNGKPSSRKVEISHKKKEYAWKKKS